MNGKNPAESDVNCEQSSPDEILDHLRRTEAQLNNITKYWPGIVFSQRPDFSFEFISPRIQDLTGVPAAEWLRQPPPFWRVIHECDAAALQKRLKELSNSTDGSTGTFRVRNVLTGRVSHIWERRQAVLNHSGELLGYEGIWIDVTRQIIAERRLMQMAWRENLGMLSSAFAHDFCNLMTGIISVSETLENEFAENNSLCSRLAMIRNGAMQANELAQRLRRFQPGSAGEKNYHDLNEIVSETEALLQKVLSRRVKLEKNLCPDQLPIWGDAVELRQVIINLALNGADAMPDGGTLTLSTSRHERPPGSVPLRGAFPRGSLACVSVRDTGAGMPPEVLESIFDPYFTTKPAGKGAGLGLCIVQSAVRSHDGAITLETSPGIGTVIHLWLPRSNFIEAERSFRSVSSRKTLLVLGGTTVSRREILQLLRAHDFYAVDAASAAEGLLKIHSDEYELNGLLWMDDRPANEELSLLRQIRATKSPLKIFLCPSDSTAGEFSSSFLMHIDSILPRADRTAFIAQLENLLSKS